MKKIISSKVFFLLAGSIIGIIIGGSSVYLYNNYTSKSGNQLMSAEIYKELQDASSDQDFITILRPYFAQIVIISGTFLDKVDARTDGDYGFDESNPGYINQLRVVNKELGKIVIFK